MAKLVVLTQSLAGKSFDLAGERTTIGRIEDNNFQIAEPSVSSRHCEILLHGNDVVVKDLNSTNGTFINGEKITESVLKPGQTLRLGNIELRLEAPGAPAAPPAPAPSSPPPPQPRKETSKTAGGVRLSDLESGGRAPGFDTTKTVFTKKKPSTALYIWIGVGVILLLIIILIIVNLLKVSGR